MGKLLVFEHPSKSSNLEDYLIKNNASDLESAKAAYYARLRDYLKESCQLMEEIEQYLKSRNHSQ